jgi:Flp pilus assembly protein TadG
MNAGTPSKIKVRFLSAVRRLAGVMRVMLASSESGQSLLELALILPLLLLLLLGTIDMGRLFYMSIEVSNAARAAAQYGSQNPGTALDTTGMPKAAQADAPDLYSSGLLNVTVQTPVCLCVGTTGPSGTPSSSTCATVCTAGTDLFEWVQVNTQATFTPWFPWPGIPSSVPLNGQATLRVGTP